MIRRFIGYLLQLAVAVAVMAGLPGQALADAQSDIEARYVTLATALSSSNLPVVRNLVAPDFRGVDVDGQALSAEGLVQWARPAGQRRNIQILVPFVGVQDDTARVRQMTVVPDLPAKPGHEMAWVYVSYDTWKRIDGVWRLQVTRVATADYFVDRKVTKHREATLNVSPPDADTSLPDMSSGDPHAAITVIQYGSVACPICARVNETLMPDFFARYVATGKVRYIYRPMETGNVGVARLGHALVECAGPDKYFSVIDAIMRAQPEMDSGGMPEQYVNAATVLVRIGGDAGMTPDQIDACFGNDDILTSMDRRNEAYLTRDGLTGTPTFLVNGHVVEGDIYDPHYLDNAIAPLLK